MRKKYDHSDIKTQIRRRAARYLVFVSLAIICATAQMYVTIGNDLYTNLVYLGDILANASQPQARETGFKHHR